ncbi:MAG: hypothetical protein J7L89_09380 [Bacteroidales bacterium]|nr:hypothetical protein [Bacteroidales bacterium]
MGYIAFVSTFPNEANMRDGYFRRVHHVDCVFAETGRTHLDIRFAKNLFKKTVQRDKNTRVMHLNAFFHFFLIYSVLKKSGLIYIHSIAKVPSVLIQLMLLKKRVPFALDLHGVMVNELKLEGKTFKARFYAKIERLCFKWSHLNIYVSKVMKEHFRTKYPFYRGREVIFATNSQPVTGRSAAETPTDRDNRQQLKETLNLRHNDVVMLYSGNTQSWQNIDLMLNIMEHLTASYIRFLILSGQKKQFEEKIKRRNIPADRINVLSVSPEDLGLYYELAHYGFILRDDMLVNRVANPTKLAEYLQYGIIPIVKLAEIGDYARFGYEYVLYHMALQKQWMRSLQPHKSRLNRQVYQKMSRQYGSEELRQAVSKTIRNTQ